MWPSSSEVDSAMTGRDNTRHPTPDTRWPIDQMKSQREVKGRRVYDIESRLIGYGAQACRIAESLAHGRTSGHIANQLIRAATSAASNYGEAQSAESRRDFVHKLKLCLKELRETRVWLRFLEELKMGNRSALATTLSANDQLIAIVYTSIETARRNMRDAAN